MYLQPYGDEQQLNLNWIINEIINLHKQLDPDYETPSFTQVYPYSNLNRLNLDWILSELKALKELAPEPAPTIDIQAVAEALVALPFDSNTSYQIYDFISKDGEIWRATEAIPAGGEWDSSKWFKTKIGTDLAVLERWINTINNSLTTEIQTRQDADTSLQNRIDGLTSANISDDSDAGGANVKASLNALRGSLTTLEHRISRNNLTTLSALVNSVSLTSVYDTGIASAAPALSLALGADEANGMVFFKNSIAINNRIIYCCITASQFVVGLISVTNNTAYPSFSSGSLDTAIELLQNSIAIVVDGKQTSEGASIGQFVILKNSTISGIDDGLYKAVLTIPSNTDIDGTYLSQKITDGGFNDILNSVNILAGKTKIVTGSVTVGSFSGYQSYPTGFTKENCYISSLEVTNGASWRAGVGWFDELNTGDRFFATLDTQGVRFFCSREVQITNWRVSLTLLGV